MLQFSFVSHILIRKLDFFSVAIFRKNEFSEIIENSNFPFAKYLHSFSWEGFIPASSINNWCDRSVGDAQVDTHVIIIYKSLVIPCCLVSKNLFRIISSNILDQIDTSLWLKAEEVLVCADAMIINTDENNERANFQRLRWRCAFCISVCAEN